MLRWLPITLLCACSTQEPVSFCESGMDHMYDPLGAELTAWPDDIFTRPSNDSPTGMTVTVAEAAWGQELPEQILGLGERLERLSGFARVGGMLLRFTGDIGELPTTAEASVAYDGLQLLDLSTTPPTRKPYRVSRSALGNQIVVRPSRPLQAHTRHALLLTADHTTASGACVSPSEAQRALLTGDAVSEELAPMAPRYAEMLEQTGLEPGDVSAVLLFTTHDDTRTIADLADHAAASDYAWLEPPTCTDRVCDGLYEAWDYRHDGILDGTEPDSRWTLPVRIWLPPGPGPHPVLFYGHGMNGDRTYGFAAFDKVAEDLGVAVVAQSALEHGEHPTSNGGPLSALNYLGVDLGNFTLDLAALRSNFNQSAFDRLQTLHLLTAHPDVDGDGIDDLDLSRVAYYGGSLGAMQGPALLALSDRFEVADIALAGGDLMDFATSGIIGSAFVTAFVQILGEEGFQRFLPVGQTLMDAGDPAVWGAHVLQDRLVGTARPDLLMPVSVEDEVVPPAAGRSLARALGLPHLTPVAEPVDGLQTAEGPLTGNLDGTTAAYFQFDRVSSRTGTAPSNHDNLQWSKEGTWLAEAFYRSWLEDGQATIREPYGPNGTP